VFTEPRKLKGSKAWENPVPRKAEAIMNNNFFIRYKLYCKVNSYSVI